MERFAAMVAGRRAAPAAKPTSAAEEGGEAYLRIQLEEIVIVKDDAYDALAAATAAARSRANGNGQCGGGGGTTTTGTPSTAMENCARAAAAARGGSSTRPAAAQGAWTAAARGVGFD